MGSRNLARRTDERPFQFGKWPKASTRALVQHVLVTAILVYLRQCNATIATIPSPTNPNLKPRLYIKILHPSRPQGLKFLHWLTAPLHNRLQPKQSTSHFSLPSSSNNCLPNSTKHSSSILYCNPNILTAFSLLTP